ncbi:MAG: hypothetical protein WA584_10950 [Pyrinomonadaceae bacterium]
MAQTNGSSNRADQIFRTGPETLVAETQTIVSGTIVNYSKQILSQSQPDENGFPLKWTVKGEIGQLQILKGAFMSGSLKFTRAEQSVMLSKDEASLYWEDIYGELQPEGQAVLFIDGKNQKLILKIIPSGKDEQDFITLVKDIVRIQALKQPDERIKQWLQYLDTASSDEGRKAALRSLVNAPVEWGKLAPELERLLSNSKNSSNIRVFGFGIAAFGVIEEKWSDNRPAVDFLCRIFLAENDARMTMQYMQHLKLILRYSDDESFRKVRQPIRRQILDCLRRREATGRLEPQLEEQFKQVWATYPEQ